MKHIHIVLLSIFTAQNIMLLPGPLSTDAYDCLRWADEAISYIDASYPEGWNSSRYKQHAKELIEKMRYYKCDEQAAVLDRNTAIHRKLERKSVELSDQARQHIDNDDPRAIPTMLITQALGCRYIHNPNNPELERTRQQAIATARANQEYWWKEETNRARDSRLLKETVCGK